MTWTESGVEWTDAEREATERAIRSWTLDDAECIETQIDTILNALAPLVADRERAAAARALAAEAKVARVEALIEGAGDGNLKTSHLRAALETNIEDAYERGRVHAEDDAYRRIRAALEAGEDRG